MDNMCDVKGEDQAISEDVTEQILKSREDTEEDGPNDTRESKAEQMKGSLTIEPFNYSSSDVNVFLDPRNGNVINLEMETNDFGIMRDQKFVNGTGRGHLLDKSMNFSMLQSQLRKVHPVGFGNNVIESHYSTKTESEMKARKEDRPVCKKKVVKQEANRNVSFTGKEQTALSRNVLLSSLLSRQGNFETDS